MPGAAACKRASSGADSVPRRPVDLEAFSAFCGHLLTQEVDGLVVCGTTGEGTALEAVEYAAVVAAADGQAAMLPDAVPATERVVAPSPGTFSSYKGLLVGKAGRL